MILKALATAFATNLLVSSPIMAQDTVIIEPRVTMEALCADNPDDQHCRSSKEILPLGEPESGSLSSVSCPAEGVALVKVEDQTEKALAIVQSSEGPGITFSMIYDLNNDYVLTRIICGETPQVTIEGAGTLTIVISVPAGVTVASP